MLRRLRQLAGQRADFAFETALATRSFAPWIAELRRGGYSFHLVFLWLSSSELAKGRVAGRVRLGGHDIPAEVIERRYHAGLRNFFSLYRELADTWIFWDNSSPISGRVLASGKRMEQTVVGDALRWRQIEERFHVARPGSNLLGDDRRRTD
jgi:predicted ABC-type ATPase